MNEVVLLDGLEFTLFLLFLLLLLGLILRSNVLLGFFEVGCLSITYFQVLLYFDIAFAVLFRLRSLDGALLAVQASFQLEYLVRDVVQVLHLLECPMGLVVKLELDDREKQSHLTFDIHGDLLEHLMRLLSILRS